MDFRDLPAMLMWWLDFFLQLIRQLFSVLCSLQSSHYSPYSPQFLTWKVGQVGLEAAGREGPLTGLSCRGPLGKTDWQETQAQVSSL